MTKTIIKLSVAIVLTGCSAAPQARQAVEPVQTIDTPAQTPAQSYAVAYRNGAAVYTWARPLGRCEASNGEDCR